MKTTVLIVEDELIIAAHLKSELEELGYQVCAIASSYEEAMTVLSHNQTDIALLDIRIQGQKSGTEIGKYLLGQGEIPFIYITSHYDKVTIAEAKATRPNGYLIKPFSKEDVYVAIEMAIINFAHRKMDTPTFKAISAANNTPRKIKKTIQYLQDHLDQKIRLLDLAALTGWNVYHFARMFKKYTDSSPYQYLQNLRMQKAQLLLETTDMTILQIALKVGFESQSHFTQSFRKFCNQTPDQFRKNRMI